MKPRVRWDGNVWSLNWAEVYGCVPRTRDRAMLYFNVVLLNRLNCKRVCGNVAG